VISEEIAQKKNNRSLTVGTGLRGARAGMGKTLLINGSLQAQPLRILHSLLKHSLAKSFKNDAELPWQTTYKAPRIYEAVSTV
jgi:hypothetical protein